MSPVDYDALAKQHGGFADMDSLATAAGGEAEGVAYPPPPSPEEESIEANPFLNPLEFPIEMFSGSAPFRAMGRALPMLRGAQNVLGPVAEATGIPALGRAGMEAGKQALSGAKGKIAGFIARKTPGLREVADLKELVDLFRKGMGGAEAASPAVEAAGSAAGRIVGGGEAEAFRQGGMSAVEALRAAGGGGGISAHLARQAAQAAPEVGSAVSRTADPVMKKAVDYYRRKGFAMLKEAGIPDDAASMSKILGKEVKSRSSLSIEDWAQIEEHATEMIARKFSAEAAAKVSARVAKKAGAALPKPKLVPKAAKPKAGSAESRVAPKKAAPRRSKASGQSTTAEVPGSLEAQLRQSVQAGEAIGRLPADQQALAWQLLRQAQQ